MTAKERADEEAASKTDDVSEGIAFSERGRARSRRLRSGILTSIMSRGLGALATMLLIPVTLGYLGAETYGLWMAIVAVTGMAVWADFGLGNGLLTKLSPLHASGDWAMTRRYVASAYGVLGATALVLTAALWGTSTSVPWASIFNVNDPEVAPLAREISLVCLTALFVNIPLALVQRVQYAYQEVAQSNLWLAAGSVLSVVLAWMAVQTQASPTVVVAGAVSGPLISNVLNSAYLYLWHEPRLAPWRATIDRTLVSSLVRLAGRFFMLSTITATALNIDNLLIARTLGLVSVTEFSVPARIFSILGLMVALVNLPLWPANGEALARGDTAWVRRMTNRMTVISGGAILAGSMVLIVGGEALLSLLTRDPSTHVSPLLLVGLAAWWLCLATASPRFMVQNAAEVLQPQFIGWIAFLVLSIPAKWFAIEWIGIEGIPLAGALLYLACVWPSAQVGYRRTLAKG